MIPHSVTASSNYIFVSLLVLNVRFHPNEHAYRIMHFFPSQWELVVVCWCSVNMTVIFHKILNPKTNLSPLGCRSLLACVWAVWIGLEMIIQTHLHHNIFRIFIFWWTIPLNLQGWHEYYTVKLHLFIPVYYFILLLFSLCFHVSSFFVLRDISCTSLKATKQVQVYDLKIMSFFLSKISMKWKEQHSSLIISSSCRLTWSWGSPPTFR